VGLVQGVQGDPARARYTGPPMMPSTEGEIDESTAGFGVLSLSCSTTNEVFWFEAWHTCIAEERMIC